MTQARSLEQPAALKLVSALGLAIWVVIAAFPLFWIAVMSIRVPVDAFSSSPLQVLFGATTRQMSGGFSSIWLATGVAAIILGYFCFRRLGAYLEKLRLAGHGSGERFLIRIFFVTAAGALVVFVAPPILRGLESVLAAIPGLSALAQPLIGYTSEHYRAVWIEHTFYRQFFNSMIVTAGVVTISLTVGTLAGYGLARTRTNLAFWLLLIALVFRALPHSVLVAGYLPAFIGSRELLTPLWTNAVIGPVLRLFSDVAPTLYGQPWAIIAVLVAINQPFTIWMLRSFFANIPTELDEAARVDGCSHFEAFRRVIIPVMWPGVITTGLFSFLLAYNDYLVTGLLLDAQSLTMVPAISQFLNSGTSAADQLRAIAAAASITAPLLLLVLVFQRHLVGGLTQGAVKG